MHWITKPQPLTQGVSALKQHIRPANEFSASSFSTSQIPKVPDRSSPSSVTEVFVTLSEMTVFSSKLTEITVLNHPQRIVPKRTSIQNALESQQGRDTQDVPGPISPSPVEDTNGKCAYPFSGFPGILQRGMANQRIHHGSGKTPRSSQGHSWLQSQAQLTVTEQAAGESG